MRRGVQFCRIVFGADARCKKRKEAIGREVMQAVLQGPQPKDLSDFGGRSSAAC